MAISLTRAQKRIHEPAASSEVRLPRRGVVRMHGRKHEPAVTCLEGVVWVTQAGDPKDHVLYAGDRLPLARRGNVVVEAMREARVRVAK